MCLVSIISPSFQVQWRSSRTVTIPKYLVSACYMLCGSFPKLMEFTPVRFSLSGLLVSLSCASKDAPTYLYNQPCCHVLAMGRACLYNVLQAIASTCQCKLNTWPCLWSYYSRGCCCCCEGDFQTCQIPSRSCYCCMRMEKSCLLHWGMIQEF